MLTSKINSKANSRFKKSLKAQESKLVNFKFKAYPLGLKSSHELILTLKPNIIGSRLTGKNLCIKSKNV